MTVRPAAREDAIALGMIAVWSFAAWQSQTFGIWKAIGGTAIGLGVLSVVLEGRYLAAVARPRPRLLGVGIVAGVAMSAATYAVFPFLMLLVPAFLPDFSRLFAVFGEPGLLIVLVFLPLVIAGEEIVWRGVVYRALEERMPWPAVTIVGTALYALAHAPMGSPVLVLACLCVGICWNLIRFWTGSLAAVFVTHVLWDFLVLVLFPLGPVE